MVLTLKRDKRRSLLRYMRCSVGTLSPMKEAALGSFHARVTFLRRLERGQEVEVILVSLT